VVVGGTLSGDEPEGNETGDGFFGCFGFFTSRLLRNCPFAMTLLPLCIGSTKNRAYEQCALALTFCRQAFSVKSTRKGTPGLTRHSFAQRLQVEDRRMSQTYDIRMASGQFHRLVQQETERAANARPSIECV
jgi:hypothetical protein